MSNKTVIAKVPTNVITGFLGAGKTTAILHLLKNKPAGQRWAVLVNEFGEIGIDGGVLAHSQAENDVFVREVPGGCICCASGVPIPTAINILLAKAKPHRLLVEPTGLGHPKSMLKALQHASFKDVIDIRNTLTLVDARNLADSRYTSHSSFLQQVQMADCIVATKSELYEGDEVAQLKQFLATQSLNDTPVYAIENGQLDPRWLGEAVVGFGHFHLLAERELKLASIPAVDDAAFPKQGYLHTQNVTKLYTALGWLFKPDFQFEKAKLDALLNDINAERLKALFFTDEGFVSYNKASGVMASARVGTLNDSRIEIITTTPEALTDFEASLLASIVQ